MEDIINEGIKDYEELKNIVRDYKSLQDIYDNSTMIESFNYEKNEYVDVNFKHITTTIKNDLSLTQDITIWYGTDNLETYTIDYKEEM